MSVLSDRMNNDMVVRGLAAKTRGSYLRSVRDLAKYYRQSPDHLTANTSPLDLLEGV